MPTKRGWRAWLSLQGTDTRSLPLLPSPVVLAMLRRNLGFFITKKQKKKKKRVLWTPDAQPLSSSRLLSLWGATAPATKRISSLVCDRGQVVFQGKVLRRKTEQEKEWYVREKIAWKVVFMYVGLYNIFGWGAAVELVEEKKKPFCRSEKSMEEKDENGLEETA